MKDAIIRVFAFYIFVITPFYSDFMKKEDCYFLGKITRRHGLQGNVILKLDTDQPELYNKLSSILVEVNGLLVPFFVEKQQWHREDKILTFKNASEAMVDQTVGKNVFLPLDTLPVLTGKQFYYHEIKAFEIVDEQGRSCGRIKEVNDQTAQHYFVLNLNDKDVIIPIIKDWIDEVDRVKKQIKMHLPDGLLEVFLDPPGNDEN